MLPAACTHSSLPVAASTAAMPPFAFTYIVRSTTIGLNRSAPLSAVEYFQATRSDPTFALVICVSAEYCDESGPPPYSAHVVCGFGAAFAAGAFGAGACDRPAWNPNERAPKNTVVNSSRAAGAASHRYLTGPPQKQKPGSVHSGTDPGVCYDVGAV